MNSWPTEPSEGARRTSSTRRLLVQRSLASGPALKRWAARQWRNGAPRTPGRGSRSRRPVATVAAPHAGFTLIELMVVLVILALLAGLVGPQLFERVDSSRVKTAETQIKMLRGALQAYRLDVGRYPSTAEGLDVLVRPPADGADAWSGPYLSDEVPFDPWDTPYRYQHPASNLQGFALYSLGADAQEGGEGHDADVGYLPSTR